MFGEILLVCFYKKKYFFLNKSHSKDTVQSKVMEITWKIIFSNKYLDLAHIVNLEYKMHD